MLNVSAVALAMPIVLMNEEASSAPSTQPHAQPAPQPPGRPVRPPDPLLPLVQAMAGGEQEAMGRLYDATSGMVHGLVLRILEHKEDAEEVTLDVFMKAWRNAGTYSAERGSVMAWLLMMARSMAIDRIRNRKAQPKVTDLPEDWPDPPAPEASPEEQTAFAQWRRRVQTALAELPREQRQALALAFFSGLSHAELAERLGQPLGTVKTRIRLGLLRLRKSLEGSGA
jgi:RNA polymerase sigma-70 factor (ECF subfamily)